MFEGLLLTGLYRGCGLIYRLTLVGLTLIGLSLIRLALIGLTLVRLTRLTLIGLAGLTLVGLVLVRLVVIITGRLFHAFFDFTLYVVFCVVKFTDTLS